jgi:aspartyl-tRNA(Asn)/glutamyl-tRNA(Gln) amidotransferase subunit B
VAVAAELGFEAMASGELEGLVDEAIAANADAWAKVLAGNDKAAGAITGHIMRATKGKADGKAVAALLESRKSSASQ